MGVWEGQSGESGCLGWFGTALFFVFSGCHNVFVVRLPVSGGRRMCDTIVVFASVLSHHYFMSVDSSIRPTPSGSKPSICVIKSERGIVIHFLMVITRPPQPQTPQVYLYMRPYPSVRVVISCRFIKPCRLTCPQSNPAPPTHSDASPSFSASHPLPPSHCSRATAVSRPPHHGRLPLH